MISEARSQGGHCSHIALWQTAGDVIEWALNVRLGSILLKKSQV
jgi:hypothetical protein